MRPSSRAVSRRLLPALLLPAVALVAVLGLSPSATAQVGGVSVFKVDVRIYENSTVDITVRMRIEGQDLSSYCNSEALVLEDKQDSITTDDGDCLIRRTGAKIGETDEGDVTVLHIGDRYVFTTSSPPPPLTSGADSSVSVTFPGKALSAQSGGKIDGNTVTWTNLGSGSTFYAEGKDKPSSVLPWVLVGLAVLAVLVGAVLGLVLLSRKKKHRPTPPPPAGDVPAMPLQAQPGFQAQPRYQVPDGLPQQIPPQPGPLPQAPNEA